MDDCNYNEPMKAETLYIFRNREFEANFTEKMLLIPEKEGYTPLQHITKIKKLKITPRSTWENNFILIMVLQMLTNKISKGITKSQSLFAVTYAKGDIYEHGKDSVPQDYKKKFLDIILDQSRLWCRINEDNAVSMGNPAMYFLRAIGILEGLYGDVNYAKASNCLKKEVDAGWSTEQCDPMIIDIETNMKNMEV
ncbi:hypothetical protein BD770DRAFT_414632 [Pilaira anomala]|nr:hypothetical protein BD770DRAFT_414632 [Pilaira anomala]